MKSNILLNKFYMKEKKIAKSILLLIAMMLCSDILYAQPTVSTSSKIYPFRFHNNKNSGNYYVVPTSNAANAKVKTSNNNVTGSDYYWFVVRNDDDSYSFIHLMSGYYLNYPEGLCSSYNDQNRQNVSLSSTLSKYSITANSGHYYIAPFCQRSYHMEPNNGNGNNLNFYNVDNRDEARWDFVAGSEIELFRSLSDFAISGADVINVLGNTAYSHTNSSCSEYFQFTLNSTTYYKTSLTAAATTSAPSSTTDGVSYTWTLNGISTQYATINNNSGVINYSQYVPNDVTATVKVTATHGETSLTVSKQVTFKARLIPTTLFFNSSALNMTSTTLSLPDVSLTAGESPILGTVTYSSNNTGCVSVSNTGELTINGAGTAKITASYAGNTTYAPSSATMTITVVNIPALDETVLSDMTITPSSQTLDLGEQVTYTVSESLNNIHRTCQAYTTITTNGNNYYKVENNYQAAAPITNEDGTPVRFTSFNWSVADGTAYFTLDPYYSATSNQVTLTRSEQKTASNKTFAISVTGVYGGQEKTASATVTIPATMVDLTALHAGEAINVGISESESMEGHYTWEPNYDAAGAPYKVFTYTSGSTNVATVDAEGTVTGVGAGTTTITIQSIKMDGTNGVSCNVTVNVSINAPEISIASDGTVTITHPVSDVQIRYTTDGSNPTASTGTVYSGTFTATNEQVVKAVAVSNNIASPVASKQYITSGISGSKVILNDFEDHNWAYYKGREGVKVGTAADAPDYNVKYKYTLYSPDPRNVKITYRGYNTENNTILLGNTTTATTAVNVTPKVSNSETENTFVYYKTLEKFVIGYFTDNADWNGIPDDTTKENYPYTVISNPFSVRPSTGSGDSKKYYGFAGWKIISGGKYIGRGNGGTYTAASDGDVLGLDELIHFVNLDADVTYTPNCTSAEIVLEATWAEATVWGGHEAHSFTGGTYETNFIVADNNIGSITQSSPCTIIGMYPDGTGNNSGSRTITGLTVTTTSTTDPYDRSNCVKVEWIRHGNGTFDANGRNMTMGRGIISSSNSGNTAQGYVYGINTKNRNAVNTVKVESGYYSVITNINNKAAAATNAINCYTILGCDYDRAQANYYLPNDEATNSDLHPYNTKLRSSKISGANGGPDLERSAGQLYLRSLIKSGVFGFGSDNKEYYFHAYTHNGQRYIEMEGGYIQGNIKGGSEDSYDQHLQRAMSIRMRNGRVDEQIGCGSTSNPCSGDRMAVVTGGRIGGWIAPGSNCSSGSTTSTSNKGATNGTSYVYFGGTAEINSHQFGTTDPSLFYQSTGGAIYGSGLGYQTTDRTGEMTLGSNVVFADDAYCERGIYGGGAIGQTLTTANIFILGGRVGRGVGQINVAKGTPFDVPAGVYGGACNRGGENSFIYMDGGIVESGIYGGSNYSGTMTGNTNVKIVGGQVGTSTTSANVHGGGYGASTIVSGNVDVTLGTKTGEDDVTYTTSGDAVIYGDVYGGSALGKVNGTTANGSLHTNVTLNAGTIHGSLYGGGLGNNTTAANVYGNVQVTVYGGSVKKTNVDGSGGVYGCNNINGAPQRNVTVDIYGTDPAPAEGQYALDAVYGGGNRANYNYDVYQNPEVTVHNCNNSIEYVYGGGNAASVKNTYVTIYGGNKIGNVFGGGNGVNGAADVTGNSGTYVMIYGGTIGNVFGGSNQNGSITGPISVNVATLAETGSPCPIAIDNVYGGGNMAPSKAGNVTVDCFDGKIKDIYGGANDADVTGNISLTINGGNFGRIFGGNNTGHTVKGNVTVNVTKALSCGLNVDYVYGGGNAAAVGENEDTRQVSVTVGGGVHVNKMVFGGGLGETAVLNGNTHVQIKGTGTRVDGNVYGGGNGAKVTGNTDVIIGE